MKKLILIVSMVIVLGMVTMAQATLIDRGADTSGYHLIYDTDQNITWYDYTKSGVNFYDAQTWAENLTVTMADGRSFTDWRLPTSVDGPYGYGYDGTTAVGYNITTSEMGYLFYEELGNKAPIAKDGSPQADYGLVNATPFSNLQPPLLQPPLVYWSSGGCTSWSGWKWHFNFSDGRQGGDNVVSGPYWALAVRSGDVAPAPTNHLPVAAPTGGGTYEINASVVLGGSVSDLDGDLLSYKWMEGITTLPESEGTIVAPSGGTPAGLPPYMISTLPLGVHTITLQISDSINTPVSQDVNVNIIDDIAPILAPAPDKTILWPANHKMVTVTIFANASDNSGGPVTLSASVTSNEPQDGLGDGDTPQDWTTPVINNGIITLQLRAERSGKGNGRIYTVTLVATDQSGNSSTAKVNISVPHDKK